MVIETLYLTVMQLSLLFTLLVIVVLDLLCVTCYFLWLVLSHIYVTGFLDETCTVFETCLKPFLFLHIQEGEALPPISDDKSPKMRSGLFLILHTVTNTLLLSSCAGKKATSFYTKQFLSLHLLDAILKDCNCFTYISMIFDQFI